MVTLRNGRLLTKPTLHIARATKVRSHVLYIYISNFHYLDLEVSRSLRFARQLDMCFVSTNGERVSLAQQLIGCHFSYTYLSILEYQVLVHISDHKCMPTIGLHSLAIS